jgi:hypothetical protein
MDIDEYKRLFDNFKFDDLEKIFLGLSSQEMEDILNQLAYNPITDESNLLVYTFLLMIIGKNETSKTHLIASRLMGTILNHIDNAENIGLYHGLKAAELDPENIDILEYLLYFNHIPEKVLNDDIAISFAQKIIKENPNSLAAKMTLSKV